MSSRNSEETKRKILKATRELLESPSGTLTRMTDIAKEAGVSRQAVYLHFPNRSELLIATTRYIDEVEDVAAQLSAVQSARGGQLQLQAFVKAWGNYIPVIYRVAKTLLALKETDSDAAQAWEDRMQALKQVCSSIVEQLQTEDILAETISVKEATDLFWSLISVQFWELITIERGISQQRYLELLEKTLYDVLISKP